MGAFSSERDCLDAPLGGAGARRATLPHGFVERGLPRTFVERRELLDSPVMPAGAVAEAVVAAGGDDAGRKRDQRPLGEPAGRVAPVRRPPRPGVEQRVRLETPDIIKQIEEIAAVAAGV
jgi:hypothetical protein